MPRNNRRLAPVLRPRGTGRVGAPVERPVRANTRPPIPAERRIAAADLPPALAAHGRFWRKVEKMPDGCWIWRAALRCGYGAFKFRRRCEGAHRLVLSWMSGRPLARDVDAMHRCDTRACVRPDHLQAGTRRDNMLDALVKGRLRGRRVEQCRYGHSLTGANVIRKPDGRRCRACKREFDRLTLAARRRGAWRFRRRAVAATALLVPEPLRTGCVPEI